MTVAQYTILLIEDEAAIRRFLRASLGSHGYHLIEASSGAEGIDLAISRQPDLILLDLGLPDMDGLNVTERLRLWSNLPIIVLSARGQELDKVAALDAGADDYLTKPFGVGELLARMRVALRHHAQQASQRDPLIQIGELRIDLVQRHVKLGDSEIHLTPIQYKLLATLALNGGKVVTHRSLLREVWGSHYEQEVHYLRVYMGQLRNKLESDPARPRYLLTEPGVGYRLNFAEPLSES